MPKCVADSDTPTLLTGAEHVIAEELLRSHAPASQGAAAGVTPTIALAEARQLYLRSLDRLQ